MSKIRRFVRFPLTLWLLLLLISCANKDAPDWFVDALDSHDIATTAVAKEPEMALQAAMKQAILESTHRIEVRTATILNQLTPEMAIHVEAELAKISKAIADEWVTTLKIKRKQTIEEAKSHRAYLLIEMDAEAQDTLLVQQVNQRRALYTTLRHSQKYRELEQLEFLRTIDWAVEETFANAEGFGIARVAPTHFLTTSFHLELQKNLFSRWSNHPALDYTFHLVTARGPHYENSPHKYTPTSVGGRYNGYQQQPLTEMETELFKRVQTGVSLAYQPMGTVLVGMGDLRARKQCVVCHDGGEGKLLGAFAYTVAQVESEELLQ